MGEIIIDELALFDGVYNSGIVFLLNTEINSAFDKYYTKKIGYWDITIKDKSKLLIIKTKRKIKRNNIFELTYKIAQEFLDIISVEIRQFNSIKDQQNYICWYLENNKKILDITFRSPINISSRMQIKIKSKDKRKKIKILKNDISVYHPALRYFRLSRINNDFIDAFRNQYLAFEQLLSSIKPKTGGEWNWISSTLKQSTKITELSKILNCKNSDVDSKFKLKIYNTRLALFHAKSGKQYYLPGDLITKKEIIDSLQLLESINWILLDEHYNTTISRGGMVTSGLQQSITNYCIKETQFKILLSNKIDTLNLDSKLDDETNVPNFITNAQYEIVDCSARIFADIDINVILSKFVNLSRIGLLGCSGLYAIDQLEKPIHLTNIIDVLRINEYVDMTSDDLHQFFY